MVTLQTLHVSCCGTSGSIPSGDPCSILRHNVAASEAVLYLLPLKWIRSQSYKKVRYSFFSELPMEVKEAHRGFSR